MIDLNQPCPKCKGSGLEPSYSLMDCNVCFGSGDLGQAVQFNLQKCLDNGVFHSDPIAQTIAKYLILISER